MTATVTAGNASPVAYRDLREWIAVAEAAGELRVVRGVHGDREVGAMDRVEAPCRPNFPGA